MSELKGQLLGMVLVLAIFGALFGVLIPAFQKAAENVNNDITVNSNGTLNYGSKRPVVEL